MLKDIAEVIVMSDGKKITASQLLEHFMFPSNMQYTYVSKLSAGEKRRLYLLTVLMKNPNFLILDEPSNALDLNTESQVVQALTKMSKTMTIIMISHSDNASKFFDRIYNLDKISQS